MSIQWGPVSEWASAATTFLAVIVALYFSDRESRERKREREENQATKISAWPVKASNGMNIIVIFNISYEPVHEVVLSYGVAYGEGEAFLKGNDNLRFVKGVPPGTFYCPEPKNPGGGMHIQEGVAISFRDARGIYWRRDAKGFLKKIERPTFQELDVEEPVGDWTTLKQMKS